MRECVWSDDHEGACLNLTEYHIALCRCDGARITPVCVGLVMLSSANGIAGGRFGRQRGTFSTHHRVVVGDRARVVDRAGGGRGVENSMP